MADDLRSTLEAAMADQQKQDTAEAPAPAPAPTDAPAPAPADKPTFDAATGKEVTDQEGSPQKPEPSPGKDTPEVTETDVKEQPETETASRGLDKAPQSWKPAEKAKWGSLDIGVRAEIQRRERETTKTLQEAAGARKFAQGFEGAVKPYVGRYQQLGIPPTKVIENLMQVDHVLATAPAATRAQLMAKMIGDYGIDIEMLAAAIDKQPIEDNGESKLEAMLAAKLAPVQQFIEGQTQREQEARQRDFQRQVQSVETMEADTVKYPHMSLVKEDMADIMEINLRRGVTVTLDQAYNRAVQMNPEASAQAVQMAKQSQAQKANESAQRSLAASLSVSGSPSSVRTAVPADDLRATIEAAVAAASGR